MLHVAPFGSKKLNANKRIHTEVCMIGQTELPPVDPAKPMQEQGLVNKYTVTKNHGPSDPKAEYFVLRMDKDPHAKAAIAAYALSCKAEFPALAEDLVNRYL